ncbi:MAG: hypothetical protein QE271_00125 [Bacteriovoracaceae bacterium]|nr:hypothetical protein [Bacteriovoracaceae bacterium]
MIIKPQIQHESQQLMNEDFMSGLNVKTSDGGKCQFEFGGHKQNSSNSEESKARDRGSGKQKRKFKIQGDELSYDKDFMKLI